MVDKKNFEDILTQAYKRMHRYTCAEASLQALLELWEIPSETYSWATAGYLGAIGTGKTTCGLLIGSSIAIGLRCGHEIQEIPDHYEEERERAIQAVKELYDEFIMKFSSTDCKTINKVDFQNGEELADWMIQKGWKKTCDIFLDFVLRKCLSLAEEGKL